MSCFYCDNNGICAANCYKPVITHNCQNNDCNKSFLDSKSRSSCVFCGSKVSHEEVAAIDADEHLLAKR